MHKRFTADVRVDAKGNLRAKSLHTLIDVLLLHWRSDGRPRIQR